MFGGLDWEHFKVKVHISGVFFVLLLQKTHGAQQTGSVPSYKAAHLLELQSNDWQNYLISHPSSLHLFPLGGTASCFILGHSCNVPFSIRHSVLVAMAHWTGDRSRLMA